MMSKKKNRAWFVCPHWAVLVSSHYRTDVEASRALRTDPRILERLRTRTPVAKSTLLRALQAFASTHEVGVPAAELVIDTRAH